MKTGWTGWRGWRGIAGAVLAMVTLMVWAVPKAEALDRFGTFALSSNNVPVLYSNLIGSATVTIEPRLNDSLYWMVSGASMSTSNGAATENFTVSLQTSFEGTYFTTNRCMAENRCVTLLPNSTNQVTAISKITVGGTGIQFIRIGSMDLNAGGQATNAFTNLVAKWWLGP